MTCNYCNKELNKTGSEINRAAKINAPLYCNKVCAGLGRRKNKSNDQKKREKQEYDNQFRIKNKERLKQEKHEYFKRTYDKEKAAIERKERMPKHVEYCRQPKYKQYKKEYDKKYKSKLQFGEEWESAIILSELEKELDSKQIKYDNGLINKTQKRKKQWQKNSQQPT